VIYPVLRQTKKEIESLSKIFPYKNAEFYTYEDLYQIIKKIESDGIKYLMFGDVPEEEENVMKFMH
jgi:hypothetical protein